MTIQPVENEEIINYSLNKGANMKRCKWCNLKNEKYIKYHDEEWGVPNFDDKYLFEMLILESFQAGLSWECILNKREAFEKAYDNFDIEKIINYDETKILELSENKNIIRNKLKIKASINNAKVFKNIKEEYQTFYNYLKSYTKDKIIYENEPLTPEQIKQIEEADKKPIVFDDDCPELTEAQLIEIAAMAAKQRADRRKCSH